jgi:CRP/FNR family cyclic AMP-dependent transcriptional regulator
VPRGAARTRVLERDPELGERLEPERLAAALPRSQAAVIRIPRGTWVPPSNWPSSIKDGPGLLVLEGFILRHVEVGGRAGGELLSAGDIMRPWQREDSGASVPRKPAWRALERVHLAILDLEFARRMAPFPELTGALMARALRRSRQLAVNVAIVHQPRVEVRVHLMLWQLADRYGTVRQDGVLLPVRLTHTVIAELVAARRPTVSAALAALERSSDVSRLPDGGWLLHGQPPLLPAS